SPSSSGGPSGSKPKLRPDRTIESVVCMDAPGLVGLASNRSRHAQRLRRGSAARPGIHESSNRREQGPEHINRYHALLQARRRTMTDETAPIPRVRAITGIFVETGIVMVFLVFWAPTALGMLEAFEAGEDPNLPLLL